MRSVCVFCGSNNGNDPLYLEHARATGALIAQRGMRLIYGGAKVGLMGAVADAALAAGCEVIGVMPQGLVEREVAHRGLTKLEVVGSMHERKALMAELSDGFLCLPGGIGSFEEFFEMWTWQHLGVHRKPVALVNTLGFYKPLLTFLDSVQDAGFLRPGAREMVLVGEDPAQTLALMESYQAPEIPRWLSKRET